MEDIPSLSCSCDTVNSVALEGGGRGAILGFELFPETGFGLHLYWRVWRGDLFMAL